MSEMQKTIKLMTRYDERNKVEHYRKFELVEKLPVIGEYWKSIGFEVVSIQPVKLDVTVENQYSAYEIGYINSGFDEERENPAIDYIAIKK